MRIIKWLFDDNEGSPINFLSPAANCPAPPTISNGQLSSTNNQYAAVVNYSCNAGYQLIGAPILFCQSSGQWTASAPQCISMYRWPDLFYVELVELLVYFLLHCHFLYIYSDIHFQNSEQDEHTETAWSECILF